MTDYAEISRKMVSILGLKNEPVSISPIDRGQAIPTGYPEPETSIRYYQSVMRARNGESPMVPASKQACHVGASALGMCRLERRSPRGSSVTTSGCSGRRKRLRT
jgi:uncharacterized protein (DUF169 family)